MEKQANIAGLVTKALPKVFGRSGVVPQAWKAFKVNTGIQPSLREMLQTRRGLKINRQGQDGWTDQWVGSNRVGRVPTRNTLPGAAGWYDQTAKSVNLTPGAGRDVMRHELMHAYQWGGRGARRWAANSRDSAKSGLGMSLGDNLVEFQARLAEKTRGGTMHALKQWGKASPFYGNTAANVGTMSPTARAATKGIYDASGAASNAAYGVGKGLQYANNNPGALALGATGLAAGTMALGGANQPTGGMAAANDPAEPMQPEDGSMNTNTTA